MRVLHVNETPPGGVVNFLRPLTREQLRRGHEVHLLSPRGSAGSVGVVQQHWSLARSAPATYPLALTQLVRTVHRLRPDVVHLHSFWAGLFGRLPAISRALPVPIVYQPHAWSAHRVGDERFARLVWTVERRASRRTDALVANCADEIAQGVAEGIDNRSQVLGVPVDTTYFVPAEPDARARWRAELGIGTSRLLLCLGRIGWQKGQDQLAAGWEADPLPDTTLLFMGTGDPSALRELAPTQWDRSVRAVGHQRDVRPWIWACDLLLQPSRYDTVGLAVAEAMACGRPVVATRANGVHEAVTAGPLPPGGAVVPLAAIGEMLAACARRLDDAGLWAREASQARARAQVQFSPAAVADRLDLAYLEAITMRGPR